MARDLSVLPVTAVELDELLRVMAPLSLEGAFGLLAAVVSLPHAMPSQLWLPQLLKGSAIVDAKHASRVAQTIMALNNYVADALMDNDSERVCPNPSDEQGCAEFAEMYLQVCENAGIEIHDQVDDVFDCLDDLIVCARVPDVELQAELGDQASAAEIKQGVRNDLVDIVGFLHASWFEQRIPPSPIRRDGPKIGRNDPCPCGSGKKYKKCCGAPS